MEERSIYNMVMSIITGAFMIPVLILGIIFQKGALSTTMICIYCSLLMIHFILKSIYYGKDESDGK